MSRNSLTGQTLGGRYRVNEILGQGGMSAVYKAFDPNLKRVVAIKVIHAHLADDPKFFSRFEEEAAAVAQLRHANIVQVFDFNHDEDLYYMVQEFVPGETLQERLRRLNKAGRRMPVAEAIRYTLDICDAAGYAHKRGMIHRDIKPANIMLDVHGHAILMDFGIVKITGGEKHTATGAVMGTALYMPPEIIRGETSDPRSDLYSLGVTLFEMVSGRPPFEADSAMTLMMMHLRDPMPDVHLLRPEVPDDLIAVIAKMLAKTQVERYASMPELVEALQQALERSQTGGAPQATLIDLPPQPGALTQPEAGQRSTLLEPQSPAGLTPAAPAAAASSDSAFPMIHELPASGGRTGTRTVSEVPARVETQTGARLGRSSPAVNKTGDLPPPPAGGDGADYPVQVSPAPRSAPLLPARAIPLAALWIVVGLFLIIFVVGGLYTARSGSANGGDKAAALAAQSTATLPANSIQAVVLPASTEMPAPTQIVSPTASTTALSAPSPTITPTPSASPTATPSPTPTLSPTPTIPPGIPFVRINGIGVDIAGHYVINYETFEYTEQLPGMHIHFFFNTVPPDQAGKPGAGMWMIYGGPRPFSGLKQSDRPVNATQLCALVANPDHSVQPGSGNCFNLPDVVVAVPLQDTACLLGPDPAFQAVTPLFVGQNVLVQGISPDEDWWYVANPQNPDEACWLLRAETLVSGDVSILGLVEPPPLPEDAVSSAFSVTITRITVDDQGRYVVEYLTQGFTEALPGTHLHFFFDNVSPDQVGMTGSGARLMFGGPSPFTGYGPADRPVEAMQMCVLVANPDHSVILESGNCLPLPDDQSP